jgi:hypothetical protein
MDYLLFKLGKAHKHIKNIELHYQLINNVIEHLWALQNNNHISK